MSLCDYHMDESHYVSNKYLDYSTAKNHMSPVVREHYRRNWINAKQRLQDGVAKCADCKALELEKTA